MWRSEFCISELYRSANDDMHDDMEEATVIVEFVFKNKPQQKHRWKCTCMDKVLFLVTYPYLIWTHLSESTKTQCQIFDTIDSVQRYGSCNVSAGISGNTTYEYGKILDIETHWEIRKDSVESVIEKIPIKIVKIDTVIAA